MSDPKTWSKNDLVREVIRLRALLKDQMESAPGIGAEVEVQGIVASTSGKPFVQMRAGEARWQMEPHEARQHALILLDAAVECERDAATIAFLRAELDMDQQQAGAFLHVMREHRTNWLEQFRDFGEIRVEEGEAYE